MKLESLMDLYLQELQDLHSAERQLTKALPKLAKNSSHPQLKEAFLTHLKQTEEHIHRLDKIFGDLGKSPGRHKCAAMEGIVKEGGELLEADSEETILDAAIITAAQRSEHYEMAAYGCAKAFAHALGREKDVQLLQQTLDEEKQTDELLSQLALDVINPLALETAGAE